jgi:hypothetical protein
VATEKRVQQTHAAWRATCAHPDLLPLLKHMPQDPFSGLPPVAWMGGEEGVVIGKFGIPETRPLSKRIVGVRITLFTFENANAGLPLFVGAEQLQFPAVIVALRVSGARLCGCLPRARHDECATARHGA